MKQVTYFLMLTIAVLMLSIEKGSSMERQEEKWAVGQMDSLAINSESGVYEDEGDFAPGLLMMVLLMLGLILVCMGVGAVVAGFLLFTIFGLVSFGLLSVSILVGLHKRSFTKGFRTFLVSFSAFCGLLSLGTGFALLNKVLHWWTTGTALIAGSAIGLLAGLGFGLMVHYLLQRLITYFSTKSGLITSK